VRPGYDWTRQRPGKREGLISVREGITKIRLMEISRIFEFIESAVVPGWKVILEGRLSLVEGHPGRLAILVGKAGRDRTGLIFLEDADVVDLHYGREGGFVHALGSAPGAAPGQVQGYVEGLVEGPGVYVACAVVLE
jgi:hypothetical protein